MIGNGEKMIKLTKTTMVVVFLFSLVLAGCIEVARQRIGTFEEEARSAM